MHLDIHRVECQYGTEALRRSPDSERRGHACGRLEHAEAILETSTQHVGFHRQHDDDADDDRLQERVDVEQVHAVADHADHQRTDEGVADVAAATEEAGSTDDDGGDRIELGERARGRRAGVQPSRRDDCCDAGQQPTQHVHRDEHRPDRDAGAPGGFGVAARGVDPAAEHEARHRDGDHRGDAGDEERRVRQPTERPAADRLDDLPERRGPAGRRRTAGPDLGRCSASPG